MSQSVPAVSNTHKIT